jgi:hypothetical protein
LLDSLFKTQAAAATAAGRSEERIFSVESLKVARRKEKKHLMQLAL